MFLLLVEVINLLTLLDFIPPGQERYHWIKPVGTCLSVAEFEIDYGVGLSVP